MKIQGAWVHTPIRLADNRGHFEEQFKLSAIREHLGRGFEVKQVNQSVSNRGVVRGVHVTMSDTGQAKYVSCPSGKLLDIVVDLRKTSVTYGQWDSIELSAVNGLSVLIGEGIGHAFLSLSDGTVANYLCTSEYEPNTELTFNPLSGELEMFIRREADRAGITSLTLSQKDQSAGPLIFEL